MSYPTFLFVKPWLLLINGQPWLDNDGDDSWMVLDGSPAPEPSLDFLVPTATTAEHDDSMVVDGSLGPEMELDPEGDAAPGTYAMDLDADLDSPTSAPGMWTGERGWHPGVDCHGWVGRGKPPRPVMDQSKVLLFNAYVVLGTLPQSTLKFIKSQLPPIKDGHSTKGCTLEAQVLSQQVCLPPKTVMNHCMEMKKNRGWPSMTDRKAFLNGMSMSSTPESIYLFLQGSTIG